MRAETQIRFHGVRGSSPVSGVDHAEFGGDTPAVEVRSGAARVFFDAGSGIRNANIDDVGEINLFLSHYHYDHLIGLPFFEPAWRSGGRLRIWAPTFSDVGGRATVERFFSPPFCPIGLSDFSMSTEVVEFSPGDAWRVGEGVEIRTASVNHPGGCVAYRLSTPAGEIVYASDVELSNPRDAARLSEFARNADYLIIDSMNNDANALARRGWGHSSWREGVIVGAAANACAIALFHHDPKADDVELNRIDEQARALDSRAFLVRQGSIATLKASRRRLQATARGDDHGNATDQIFSRRS